MENLTKKKLDEEEAAMIQRKREKRWKQKERRAERKRNEQIAMQKEAYVQAWKEIEELKNHELLVLVLFQQKIYQKVIIKFQMKI